MSLTAPEGVVYGLVLGRWVQIIGDTSVDPDKLPDTIPVKGSILFTRKQKTTARLDTTQTDGTYVGIAKQNVTGYLRTVDGELAPAADSEDTGLWLVTGIYTVIFTLSGTTWPSFDIEVTAAHTAEAPLDLISASPYVAPVGATPVVIMVPASIPDGYLLAKNGASFTGIDPATLGGAGAAPVTSVNTKTGAVTLNATDVGADPAGTAAWLVGTLTPADIGAAPALGTDDNYVTDAEKAALHPHANKTALDQVSGKNTGDATGVTVTLTNAGWSDDSQTVTAAGVTTENLILVAPIPADQTAYVAAGIICTTQGAGTLTFTCTTTPTAALNVQAVIL